ncbi:MAG: hypothetical protein JNL32_15545 [Candidatus Kapabacteria bacterium]|nr:hypothetical protein [Candidatus Kapabacteria bacterium]
MRIFLAIIALVAISAVSSLAQINNSGASAVININVAQNAQTGFLSFGAAGNVTMPAAYIASPVATQTAATTMWLVVGQNKVLSANNLAPVFVVQGERGAQITANVSASVPTGATVSAATWTKSVDGTAWTAYSNGNNTLSNGANTTIGPAPGQLGQFLLRYDATVTGATPSTSTSLTATVTISAYTI